MFYFIVSSSQCIMGSPWPWTCIQYFFIDLFETSGFLWWPFCFLRFCLFPKQTQSSLKQCLKMIVSHHCTSFHCPHVAPLIIQNNLKCIKELHCTLRGHFGHKYTAISRQFHVIQHSIKCGFEKNIVTALGRAGAQYVFIKARTQKKLVHTVILDLLVKQGTHSIRYMVLYYAYWVQN